MEIYTENVELSILSPGIQSNSGKKNLPSFAGKKVTA